MDFREYQEKAKLTAIYPNMGNNLTYPTLGLTGEAGEIANKVKKIERDDKGFLSLKTRDQLIDELGDVLWYIAALATELGADLNDIAKINIVKLKHRQECNTISGSGDKR
jgi:NTP pyrophosphatase (non-canonical NTP hydrolase)